MTCAEHLPVPIALRAQLGCKVIAGIKVLLYSTVCNDCNYTERFTPYSSVDLFNHTQSRRSRKGFSHVTFAACIIFLHNLYSPLSLSIV